MVIKEKGTIVYQAGKTILLGILRRCTRLIGVKYKVSEYPMGKAVVVGN